jgi:hypothetical protein
MSIEEAQEENEKENDNINKGHPAYFFYDRSPGIQKH